MILYPTQTINKYAKSNFLIAKTIIGEVEYTYYIDKNGSIWKCGDWITCKPEVVYLSELFKLTLDTPRMIENRYINWMKENNYPV